MHSCPPAMTISAVPFSMLCAASCTAFRPDPQTRLTVIALIVTGSPACSAVWRAGFCPHPAVSTCPIMTSSTASADTLLCDSSAFTTMAPSCTALCVAISPIKRPVGVRNAATITASFFICLHTRISGTTSGTRSGPAVLAIISSTLTPGARSRRINSPWAISSHARSVNTR